MLNTRLCYIYLKRQEELVLNTTLIQHYAHLVKAGGVSDQYNIMPHLVKAGGVCA